MPPEQWLEQSGPGLPTLMAVIKIRMPPDRNNFKCRSARQHEKVKKMSKVRKVCMILTAR
jgi:hypothetical protein